MTKNLLSIILVSVFSLFGSAFADGNCGGSGADIVDKVKQEKKDKEA